MTGHRVSEYEYRIPTRILRCYSWRLLTLIVGDPEDGGEMVREGWSVELLPSPTRDPEGCRRPGKFAKGSFVCDPDGLLTLQGVERYVRPYCSLGMTPHPGLRSREIRVDNTKSLLLLCLLLTEECHMHCYGLNVTEGGSLKVFLLTRGTAGRTGMHRG